jgi:hypothetical protein
MKRTRFLHGYDTLVPQRALPYLPSGAGGYEYVAVGDSADGRLVLTWPRGTPALDAVALAAPAMRATP